MSGQNMEPPHVPHSAPEQILHFAPESITNDSATFHMHMEAGTLDFVLYRVRDTEQDS